MARALTRGAANGQYWLIWAKAVADQMPKNKGIDSTTYRGQGYRQACHDIAMALAEKVDEIEEGR